MAPAQTQLPNFPKSGLTDELDPTDRLMASVTPVETSLLTALLSLESGASGLTQESWETWTPEQRQAVCDFAVEHERVHASIVRTIGELRAMGAFVEKMLRTHGGEATSTHRQHGGLDG